VDIFGAHIFTFVLCAYMTTVLKKYFHYVGSYSSRFFLVFAVVLINFFANFCLRMMFGNVDVVQVFKYVFMPEMAATLVVTSFVFVQLQKCVSRFFV
jgi:cell shape-determining protein MreD